MKMSMMNTVVVLMCALATKIIANPLTVDLGKRIPDCPSGYKEYSQCKGWIEDCQPSSSFYRWMLQNCKATCNVCKVGPVVIPYLTPTVISVNMAECLNAHNSKRALHGVPNLRWDRSLASGSVEWALHLAKMPSVVLEHSKGDYGENIYYKASYPPGSVSNCAAAVESWYDEIKDYNFNSPGFSHGTGHFTQVVWKSSTNVGVGIAAVTRGEWTYTFVVARYSPVGNMRGQFSENVPRALGG